MGDEERRVDICTTDKYKPDRGPVVVIGRVGETV
jgi:hypothetical protein